MSTNYFLHVAHALFMLNTSNQGPFLYLSQKTKRKQENKKTRKKSVQKVI